MHVMPHVSHPPGASAPVVTIIYINLLHRLNGVAFKLEPLWQ